MILVLDTYSDIVKYADTLIDLECLTNSQQSLSVYVGGDEYCGTIVPSSKVTAHVLMSLKKSLLKDVH